MPPIESSTAIRVHFHARRARCDLALVAAGIRAVSAHIDTTVPGFATRTAPRTAYPAELARHERCRNLGLGKY